MDFKTMKEANERIPLVWCDYIAHLIKSNLKYEDSKDQNYLSSVGNAKLDLDENGFMLSSKKTILVEDRNGKPYKITVEEV
jgi:hypothetical protein